MPEEQSSGSSNPVIYRFYCYTVQLFAQEGDISWSGTYGVAPIIGKGGKAGDSGSVKAGSGKEGRITGGELTAASEADATAQLSVLYGEPNINWRLLSLEPRGVAGLGES